MPSIVFTKGGGLWLEQIAAIGCDAVGLDWTVNLGDARRRIDDRCALQGNLDPMALFAPPERIAGRGTTRPRCLRSSARSDGRHGGHVFNLGHGISQFTPPEAVQTLVDAVHQYSRKLRS